MTEIEKLQEEYDAKQTALLVVERAVEDETKQIRAKRQSVIDEHMKAFREVEKRLRAAVAEDWVRKSLEILKTMTVQEGTRVYEWRSRMDSAKRYPSGRIGVIEVYRPGAQKCRGYLKPGAVCVRALKTDGTPSKVLDVYNTWQWRTVAKEQE